MQLFWSRVPAGWAGAISVLRKPLLACSFVSRVETKQLLSVLRFFKHLLVVLKHFYFFVSVDFCCCYALVCILQCCLLPSSFVILMSRWISPIKPFAFTLFPLFFIKKKGVIFKARWRFNVLLFLQLSSQVCCFCVSLFFRFHYTFAGGSVKYFWMLSFFLTRWCWVDEGSFDSWESSMRFLFSVSTRMNRHFPFCRYIIWVDKWHVSVFTIKNKVTEICTCGWRVISQGWPNCSLEKAFFINVIWRLPGLIDLPVMLHKKKKNTKNKWGDQQFKKEDWKSHAGRLITMFSLFWVQQSSRRRSWGINVSSCIQVPRKDAL